MVELRAHSCFEIRLARGDGAGKNGHERLQAELGEMTGQICVKLRGLRITAQYIVKANGLTVPAACSEGS